MTNLSVVFPGQGSQSVGMLADVAEVYPIVRETYEEASEALHYDLWDIVHNNVDDKLNQTQFTQPAILTASYALWKILQEHMTLTPNYLAGHSLGEYTALICAGALEFKQTVKLVENRGRFMQEAVPVGEGAMAAIIGLDDDTVFELCQQAIQTEFDVVTPANFNALGQTVIAGQTEPVNRVVALAKDNGAKIARIIPVSVPSHCILMHPATEKLAAEFNKITISTPNIRVLHNANVESHTDPEGIKDALLKQLDQPVRWVETVQTMIKSGVDTMIECGPGKILSGLIKRIDIDVNTINIGTLEGLTHFLETHK